MQPAGVEPQRGGADAAVDVLKGIARSLTRATENKVVRANAFADALQQRGQGKSRLTSSGSRASRPPLTAAATSVTPTRRRARGSQHSTTPAVAENEERLYIYGEKGTATGRAQMAPGNSARTQRVRLARGEGRGASSRYGDAPSVAMASSPCAALWSTALAPDERRE